MKNDRRLFLSILTLNRVNSRFEIGVVRRNQRHFAMSHAPVVPPPMTYHAVESSDLPPTRWSDGTFECINDPQVCVLGACPMGCVQYLYAVRKRGSFVYHNNHLTRVSP